MSLPPTLAVQVYTCIVSTVLLKVCPTKLDVAPLVFEFLSFAGKGYGLRLLRSIEGRMTPPRDISSEVQHGAVVNLLDKLFETCTNDEFCRVMMPVLACDGPAPVNAAKHYFAADPAHRVTQVDGWCTQSIIDLSCCVVMVEVLSRHERGDNRKDVKLATAVALVQQKKTELSLRLRAFRHLARKSNVGKTFWELVDKMQHSVDSVGVAEKKSSTFGVTCLSTGCSREVTRPWACSWSGRRRAAWRRSNAWLGRCPTVCTVAMRKCKRRGPVFVSSSARYAAASNIRWVWAHLTIKWDQCSVGTDHSG